MEVSMRIDLNGGDGLDRRDGMCGGIGDCAEYCWWRFTAKKGEPKGLLLVETPKKKIVQQEVGLTTPQ